MFEERRHLEKACEDLEGAVRKAILLTLQVWQRQQKKKEAADWQAAWQKWNISADGIAHQLFESGECQAVKPG